MNNDLASILHYVWTRMRTQPHASGKPNHIRATQLVCQKFVSVLGPVTSPIALRMAYLLGNVE